MAKSQSRRNRRSDKFPLTLHPTGQYCKKIKGKLYYFGNDKKMALESYLTQASSLHRGLPYTNKDAKGITLKLLANQYLDHQESRVKSNEIKQRQLYACFPSAKMGQMAVLC